MANDRFKIKFSASKRRQERVLKQASQVNVCKQPLRKHDERFNAGKYKGYKASDVPKSYLEWVLGNWKGITKDQENLIRKFL